MNKAPIVWVNLLIFLITGLIALIAIPLDIYFNGLNTVQIIATILCLGYCGMSITAGYHRLWSHKTYQAHAFVRFVYAIGGAFALQNSILHWCSDHRNHHRFVDNNDKDPYSAKRGFWHSHIGWMIREYQGKEYKNYNNTKDLQKDKIVMWQHKYYLPLAIATNFGIPILLGWLNGNILGMLLWAGVLRLVLSHHFTFFINSLAHIWGSQPYSKQHTAKDNAFLALLTYGEGYHNFHHTFEYDYRNGIRWWHFDPTKWFIKAASYVGLTSKLRITPEERIEKALAENHFETLKQRLLHLPHNHPLVKKLEHEYEALQQKMNDFYSARKRLLEIKRKKLAKDYKKTELYTQVQELKLKFEEHKNKFFDLTIPQAA
ncbi:delta-9 fatty acid desaturase [Catenovulum agarivorans DS-2]|uniref:Delta-9 fatty acid desaturase n=1 Tax=Catenovulum agarivorans DS-2 TaxID=1328313 RepID=W7QBX0_9ALTE|nr:fatty acid desaturase [Catenovulum agarivorans]EWH10349.1 delta-9 fatty acid desaturase [Catenovulum agarivorans DS-2]